ncbi:MAG: recombinase family protein [Bacillota bacterium]
MINKINDIYPANTPKCYSYIRFSTLEQSKGDSTRRQLQASEEYAREHGLELDKDLRDEGLSAYKGEHRTKGALGRFLARVESGVVSKGSVLLIESLDRLSREEILQALQQFLDIIRAGIRIVTLMDRMEYTEETINNNIGQLMMSLVIMSRAHEESLTKSKRVKAAWSNKRELIRQRKLTAQAPAWLKLSEDKTYFESIPERVETLNIIFKQKLKGLGSESIAHRLNQDSRWKPKNGWRKSYVEKILRNRAVIGEFQAYELVMENGKRARKPSGDPIPDYYPVAVHPDLFQAVQARIEKNQAKHGNGGGRNGKINNLFGHIAVCGYCKGPMEFVNKGPGSKGGQYLVCDNARRGRGCKYRAIRYGEFEEMVLSYCRNLNPADLLPGHDERESKLFSMRQQLAAAQSRQQEITRMSDNLTDSIATTDNQAVRKTLEERLSKILAELHQIDTEVLVLEREVKQLSSAQEDTETRLESMRELLSFLRERKVPELIEVRRKLREELRELIDRIEVYPVGRYIWTEEKIQEALTAMQSLTKPEELEKIETELRSRIENKELRQYNIYFKGGSWRVLKPTTAQKMTLDLDLEAGKLVNLFQGLEGETEKISC